MSAPEDSGPETEHGDAGADPINAPRRRRPPKPMGKKKPPGAIRRAEGAHAPPAGPASAPPQEAPAAAPEPGGRDRPAEPGSEQPPRAAAPEPQESQEPQEAPERATVPDESEQAPAAPAPTAVQVRSSPPPAAPAPGAAQWNGFKPPPHPMDLAETCALLRRKGIKRETLNAAVPEGLRLVERIDMFRLINRLGHLPDGDLFTVALEHFLRGSEQTVAALPEPWSAYRGAGTPDDVPHAEEAIADRYAAKTTLRPSVPVAADLPHRLETFRVINGLRRDQRGDVVAVAVDRLLRVLAA